MFGSGFRVSSLPVKLRSRGMVPRAPRSPDMSKRDCCVCVCQFVYSWHAARGYPSSASMQARAVMSFHAAGWPMEPCSNAEVNLICELRYGTAPHPRESIATQTQQRRQQVRQLTRNPPCFILFLTYTLGFLLTFRIPVVVTREAGPRRKGKKCVKRSGIKFVLGLTPQPLQVCPRSKVANAFAL